MFQISGQRLSLSLKKSTRTVCERREFWGIKSNLHAMIGSTNMIQLLKSLFYPDQNKYIYIYREREASKNCTVQEELSRDIMQYVNHSTRGRARGHEICGCYTTKQQNTTEKLSMEIRQTSSRKPEKGEKCSRFSSSPAGRTRFVSPSPLCRFSFLALIAVYRERVITCESGRVIFLPRV